MFLGSVWRSWTALNTLQMPEVVRRSRAGDFESIAHAIRAGEEQAATALYIALREVFTPSIVRQLGYDRLDDILHEAFAIALRTVQQGYLTNPTFFLSFCGSLTRNRIRLAVRKIARDRKQIPMEDLKISAGSACFVDRAACSNPYEAVLAGQLREIIAEELARLHPRYRELLERFYVQEQSPERIQAEMGMTPDVFRIIKSRAKDRLLQAVQKTMQNRRSLRASA